MDPGDGVDQLAKTERVEGRTANTMNADRLHVPSQEQREAFFIALLERIHPDAIVGSPGDEPEPSTGAIKRLVHAGSDINRLNIANR